MPQIPRMCRAMFAAQNDEPVVADDNGLGVRDNSYMPHDVSVGANGIVPPSEGMSLSGTSSSFRPNDARRIMGVRPLPAPAFSSGATVPSKVRR